MQNIHYKSENLPNFYANNRTKWKDIYPSEKKVIDFIGFNKDTSVLDMGCACGGLGLALNEKFGITGYTGVDINGPCIDMAKTICRWGEFHAADFLEIEKKLPKFDTGFSLGAADWNIRTEELLKAVFSHIKNGGSMVFSCRLTNKTDVKTYFEAEQQVRFHVKNEKETETEYAPYKVYKLDYMLDMLLSIGSIAQVYGYGYWGKCPVTVKNLPFEEVFYMVFGIRKGVPEGKHSLPRIILDAETDLMFST